MSKFEDIQENPTSLEYYPAPGHERGLEKKFASPATYLSPQRSSCLGLMLIDLTSGCEGPSLYSGGPENCQVSVSAPLGCPVSI